MIRGQLWENCIIWSCRLPPPTIRRIAIPPHKLKIPAVGSQTSDGGRTVEGLALVYTMQDTASTVLKNTPKPYRFLEFLIPLMYALITRNPKRYEHRSQKQIHSSYYSAFFPKTRKINACAATNTAPQNSPISPFANGGISTFKRSKSVFAASNM